MNPVVITGAKGVFTNGDSEDIRNDYFAVLKNLQPVAGSLEKTFGAGDFITDELPAEINNICVFVHDEFTDGKKYIAVYVHPTTKVVTLYALDNDVWTDVTLLTTEFSLSEIFYHNADFNPILQIDDVLRIFPGGVGKANGSNESKAIWLSRIDRTYFDSIYAPTAKFYGYPTTIAAPSISGMAVTATVMAGGDFDPTGVGVTKYYKFSDVYDGIQESMLSGAMAVNYTQNTLGKFAFSITKASHNLRITARKVYRADTEDGPYKYIHTIDFLRTSAGVFRGSASATVGAYSGNYVIYVPALSTWEFDAALEYRILVNGTAYPIDNPNGGADPTGHKAFALTTPDPAANHLDEDWILQSSNDSFVANIVECATGASGAYTGTNMIITYYNFGNLDLTGRVVYFGTESRVITSNKNYGILFGVGFNPVGASESPVAWVVMGDEQGFYYGADNTTTVDYLFFDNALTVGAEHPLEIAGREVSIKVNGEFYRWINGRLWVSGKVVADPGGTEEEHSYWAYYSELWQPDVLPVGNVRRIVDQDGGPVTGIANLFNEPVFLKSNAIIILWSKEYPNDPTMWFERESEHNIGNVAKRGHLTASGGLYVSSKNGIYRLRPNNFAESDSTPTEMLRVSEPINDKYMALSEAEKALTVAAFEEMNGEVVFVFGEILQ